LFLALVAATETSPVEIGTAYEAKFGNMVAGQKIFVRAYYISTSTGQAGIPVSAMAIVAA
jgi:hypothetical protein